MDSPSSQNKCPEAALLSSRAIISPMGFLRLWKERLSVYMYNKDLNGRHTSFMFTLRTWNSRGLQYFENCLRLVLGCLSFSCQWTKIHGKFTKCYATKPVINHWTCNVNGCGSEVWLTLIPIFQGENAKHNGLLLICNLKVLSAVLEKKKESPNIKAFRFGAYLATVVLAGCWVG